MAQTRWATASSIAWLTVAKTPNCIKSAMILKGFCLRCSASSRTTIGGLIVMTGASEAKEILGAADSGFVGDFDPIGSRAPAIEGPDGALAPRKLRISPRLGISPRRCSGGLRARAIPSGRGYALRVHARRARATASSTRRRAREGCWLRCLGRAGRRRAWRVPWHASRRCYARRVGLLHGPLQCGSYQMGRYEQEQ